MGKIFGICDNPVSTIGNAIKAQSFKFKNPVTEINKKLMHEDITDKFVSKEKKMVSNPFIKMRNGIGKLMSHFSKKNA